MSDYRRIGPDAFKKSGVVVTQKSCGTLEYDHRRGSKFAPKVVRPYEEAMTSKKKAEMAEKALIAKPAPGQKSTVSKTKTAESRIERLMGAVKRILLISEDGEASIINEEKRYMAASSNDYSSNEKFAGGGDRATRLKSIYGNAAAMLGL